MIWQAKNVGEALLHRLGYKGQQVRVSRVPIAALTGEEAPYYKEYSSPWAVFSPWTGHPDFQTIYGGVAGLTAGSPERGYMLISLARYAKHLPGDFAECGVYRGGSALALCQIIQGTQRTLYLFDSFQGLPKPHPKYDPFFREGEYAAAAEEVQQRLNDFQSLTDFRIGWLPDTFVGLESQRYAFAHIDVDLYQPTLDSCAYFYPRLTPGGVLLFDEYGFAAGHGEKVAVDEYFADKRERPIALITGQALVLKLPSQ
jgi:O-methyltransferase